MADSRRAVLVMKSTLGPDCRPARCRPGIDATSVTRKRTCAIGRVFVPCRFRFQRLRAAG